MKTVLWLDDCSVKERGSFPLCKWKLFSVFFFVPRTQNMAEISFFLKTNFSCYNATHIYLVFKKEKWQMNKTKFLNSENSLTYKT